MNQLTVFNNPLYQGQDPFLMRHTDGYYYFVASFNHRESAGIYVAKSKSMLEQGEKKIVFDSRGTQKRIFAPELFFIDGKWYIYYCADYQSLDWQHMAGVLESVTDDPQGEYIDRGPLYTGENGTNYQANDFTVFRHGQQLYAVWGTMDHREQPAIAPLETPCTITADRSLFPPHRGEGPRVLQRDGRVIVTVSMGPFANHDYHLAAYLYDGQGDILSMDSWSYEDNWFNETADVLGPGRASFVQSADGTEDYMVYHSKVFRADDNGFRQVSIQKFTWEDGRPVFGRPVSPLTFLPLPAGDPGLGDIYYAEDAIRTDAPLEQEYRGYQGSGYARLVNNADAQLLFTVTAAQTGPHYLRLRYAYGTKVEGEYQSFPTLRPRPGQLSLWVNGNPTEPVTLDKTALSWEEWMYAGCRIPLNQGENQILLKITDAQTPQLHINYIAVDTL